MIDELADYGYLMPYGSLALSRARRSKRRRWVYEEDYYGEYGEHHYDDDEDWYYDDGKDWYWDGGDGGRKRSRRRS